MFVCRRAIRLPTVIVSADSPHISGSTTSLRDANAMRISWSRATKPADFDSTARNAVIGVGAPS